MNVASTISAAKSPAETAPGGEQGLIGYWSFDEGKGEAAKDSSKYGNDGKLTGAKWAKGVIGSALEFNGVNDFANMSSPGSGLFDKAVSVEAWIQSTGNNGNANLVFAGPDELTGRNNAKLNSVEVNLLLDKA